MRLIDADELKTRLGSLINIAKSDAQKTIVGRSIFIVNNMPEIMSWNNVQDTLPPENTDVLLMFPMNMAVGFLKSGKWFVNSGCNWFTDVIEDDGDEPPTHWMPLPTPPKEDDVDAD